MKHEHTLQALDHIRKKLLAGVTIERRVCQEELDDESLWALLDAIRESDDPTFWGCSYDWHVAPCEFDAAGACHSCGKQKSEHEQRLIFICEASK